MNWKHALIVAIAIFGLLETKVCLASSPQRIVCLTPALAEIVADYLGQETSRLVGVSDQTDYPEILKTVPSVGPYHKFQLERVVALTPDLILASKDGNSPLQVRRLQDAKFNVVIVDTARLSDIRATLQTVGEALGKNQDVSKWISIWDQGIEQFKKRAQERTKKTPQPLRVMLQVGQEPLFVASGNTFLSDAVELIGAVNVFGNLERRYMQISKEEVVRRNPDEILVLGSLSPSEMNAANKRWGNRRRVIVVPADSLVRPSLRLLEGLALLEKKLYAPTKK